MNIIITTNEQWRGGRGRTGSSGLEEAGPGSGVRGQGGSRSEELGAPVSVAVFRPPGPAAAPGPHPFRPAFLSPQTVAGACGEDVWKNVQVRVWGCRDCEVAGGAGLQGLRGCRGAGLQRVRGCRGCGARGGAGRRGVSPTPSPGPDPAPPPVAGLLRPGAAGLRRPEDQRVRGCREPLHPRRQRGPGSRPPGRAGQVEVAKKYIDYHMKKYGFQTPNVNFIHGYIEKLGEAGIKDESYDIIVSNCVINLVPNKRQVLQEAYRVLKPGGELYFSDVYASLDLPEEIRSHRVLWGECIGGALFWKDLFTIAQEIGFCPPRLVSAFPITIQNKELEKVLGNYQFVSANFRLFKLLEKSPVNRCEVIYNGGITGFEKELVFDANFTFKEGEVVEVDEETAAILQNSRFAESFLIRPVGEKLPTPGSGSRLEPKEMITDPFKLVKQLKTKPTCSTASSACSGSKKCG
uniref:Arsenite methyltransferase n=1 Tax=Ornithorhynchus anatinus TaxID=9258 RepID=A0A6I8NG46_ORNAN